ncbi:ABC transporter ATP-binding protein [Tamlana sp. I1]|uniref:ABC transporter ATP-binding protein n=1 Tax=Tamlana sp. I1 TaxID=2762061 RepID=UPI00188DDD46|nr:ABC transporter ATP-binding protein [Tamlana sp. I1]
MIISGSNLSKSYKSLKALNDVSISCSAGKISGIVGANGSGKTTLFKILLKILKPDSGSVIINSKRVKPIGGIIEKPALYEYLNAYDNLKLFASIQGAKSDKESIINGLLKVGLPLDRKDPVKNFSMGMKQRLGIAIALLNNPECLVLDEPFSGLDPMGISSLKKLIITLAEEEKLAILISSHIIDELAKICHTLTVLKKGEIVHSGTTKALINKSTQAYTISANNIANSSILQAYNTVFKENSVTVQIDPEHIAVLLQKLYEEHIQIESCVPEINMNKLFET